MITYLKVRNLAIVEELEIEPGPGLNVLTGETGAGKSLLIDSLEFLRGGRSSSETIRSGAEKMSAESVFELPGDAAPIFDEHDIEIVHGLVERFQYAQLLAGVNCRDLATLQVVPGRLRQLAYLLPRSVPRVAESGIETPAAAQEVAGAGYTLALVGGALMKAANPYETVRAMLNAGRAGAKVRA